MIITGIIIIAVTAILMLFAMVAMIGSAAADRPGGVIGAGIVYFLLAAGYISGFAITAIGIVHELT